MCVVKRNVFLQFQISMKVYHVSIIYFNFDEIRLFLFFAVLYPEN